MQLHCIMYFISFERLHLELGERIVITDEKTEVRYGSYLDEYNRATNTFLFMDSINGYTEVLQVNKMQRIERCK